VIYTSDHGDNLGARGLWGKATMYEESAGIPMLLAGEGMPGFVVTMKYRSAAATWTYSEGDRPLRCVQYKTGFSVTFLMRLSPWG
jgi:hypothetical protein